ncbi:MAG: hypothetical protein ABIJ16_07550 [Bacteroidota bacterium]
MKKTVLFFAAMFLCILIFGQEENVQIPAKDDDGIHTILGDVHSYGGYGAFTMNYTEIDGKEGMSIGGRGGLIIGHGLTIGLGGYGFFNDYYYDPYLFENVNIEGGYGGFFLEPIILPKFPVHLAFPVFFGAGGVAYMSDNYYNDYDEWESDVRDSDAFLVVEPGVELELNLLKFFRISFGASYRYTTDINLMNTKKDVLNGLSTGITFKLGGF